MSELVTISKDGVVKYDWSDEKAQHLLKNTIAKGANAEEFALFREMCRATGLNPFTKEIWFIKTKGGVQLMTGINGLYAIANRHPQYDGIEVEVVEESGKPQTATARCYRKDRGRPSVGVARWSEYGKAHGVWTQMPFLMLEKCAESLALRKAFPQEMNGLYTQEEMGSQYGVDNSGGTVDVDIEFGAVPEETEKLNRRLKAKASKKANPSLQDYALEAPEYEGELLSEIGSEVRHEMLLHPTEFGLTENDQVNLLKFIESSGA